MNDALTIPLQAIGTVLAADLVAGLIHWVEDAYIREDTPLVGCWIGRTNTLHHHLPRRMTQNTWWQSSWDLVAAMTALVGIVALLGCLTWHVWLFAMVAANANEVHKWSHRTRRENGQFITWLQDLHLLQTPYHHAIHHTNPKDVRYCPITNVVNPVLDALRFWSGLEWLVAYAFGICRKPDTSVPGQGTPPPWIVEMRHGR
ncbi:MAG: hypothetical protein JNM99_09965 [Verrucomicrobiaceae bacterium]|nr:hypothetical protein [Verrucomicrobiaceae bacterium]